MRKSKILEKDREALVRLSKRLTPEQRLRAHLRHSQLISQIYQAGVRYRLGRSASPRKKTSRK